MASEEESGRDDTQAGERGNRTGLPAASGAARIFGEVAAITEADRSRLYRRLRHAAGLRILRRYTQGDGNDGYRRA